MVQFNTIHAVLQWHVHHRSGQGWGLLKFINFFVEEIFNLTKVPVTLFQITFIFDRCRHRYIAASVKYECDIRQATTVLIILENLKNNGTEEIDLVTPTLKLKTCPIVTLEITNEVIYRVSAVHLLNSLHAKFFRGNINIYLHFMSFLHTEMP